MLEMIWNRSYRWRLWELLTRQLALRFGASPTSGLQWWSKPILLLLDFTLMHELNLIRSIKSQISDRNNETTGLDAPAAMPNANNDNNLQPNSEQPPLNQPEITPNLYVSLINWPYISHDLAISISIYCLVILKLLRCFDNIKGRGAGDIITEETKSKIWGWREYS